MLMLPTMEINIPPTVPPNEAPKSPDAAAAAAVVGSSSTTTQTIMAPQQPAQASAVAPKLKRSPYLAAMCTNDRTLYDDDHDDDMMDDVVVAPPPLAVVGEPNSGDFETPAANDALHRGSQQPSTGRIRRSSNGGHKRHYSDLFELRRPPSSSGSGDQRRHSHGLSSGSNSTAAGVGRPLSSSAGPHQATSSFSSAFSSGGSAGHFSNGSSTAGSGNGPSSNKVRRPVMKHSRPSTDNATKKMSSYSPSSQQKPLLAAQQRSMLSVHSLPQRGAAAVMSSSHGHAYNRQRAANSAFGNARRNSKNLQYYYPNPFSQSSLLSLVNTAQRGGSAMNTTTHTNNYAANKSSRPLDDFHDSSGSSGGNDGDSSSDVDSYSSSDEDETVRRKNMRMSAPGESSIHHHHSSSSRQDKDKDQMPAVPPFSLPQRIPSNEKLKHKQTKYQNYCSSLLAIHASQHPRHAQSAQFFPSVLDPLDGREYDLNRESRNEVWKEICLTNKGGGGAAVTDCDGEEPQEDEDMQDLTSDSDNLMNNEGSQVMAPGGGGGGGLRRRSSNLQSSVHSTCTPCVSDDNNSTEGPEELLARAVKNGSNSSSVSPRSSGTSGGVPVAPAKRSLTVGAGLAYGRIPDWHVRSRLSKD